jgi:hypothetical protein
MLQWNKTLQYKHNEQWKLKQELWNTHVQEVTL